jgi:hypothetical protein
MTTSQTPDHANVARNVGRNEPCPCGSGKKFKRCHGVDAAPKLSLPNLNAGAAPAAGSASPPNMPGLPPGFDPSKLDPQMMAGFAQALQRLPKSQLQKLQGIVLKAQSGKDVSREAMELEKSLPPQFQEMMRAFALQATMSMAGSEADLTPDQARQIVEKAAAEGKISKEEAETLLAASASAPALPAPGEGGASAPTASAEPEKRSLWKRLLGK